MTHATDETRTEHGRKCEWGPDYVPGQPTVACPRIATETLRVVDEQYSDQEWIVHLCVEHARRTIFESDGILWSAETLCSDPNHGRYLAANVPCTCVVRARSES